MDYSLLRESQNRYQGHAVNRQDQVRRSTPDPITDSRGSFTRHTSLPSQSSGEGFDTKVARLERSILSHEDLVIHIDIIRVYLSIGKELLEPISYLRQEGLWKNAQSTSLTDGFFGLPHRDQVDDLRSVQPSLYESPPSELFNLVCQYRWHTNFQLTGIIERLDAVQLAGEFDAGNRHVSGKTAPDGHKYACPSRGCKKSYTKSGHLRNHIEKTHPDFLRLRPDWRPQFQPTDTTSSSSSSPHSERYSLENRQEVQRRSSRIPQDPYLDLPPASPMNFESEYSEQLDEYLIAPQQPVGIPRNQYNRDPRLRPQTSRQSSNTYQNSADTLSSQASTIPTSVSFDSNKPLRYGRRISQIRTTTPGSYWRDNDAVHMS